jgi:CheY-like chemotaxis protein
MTVLVAMAERHLNRLVEINLQRQGWSVVKAESDLECLDKARHLAPNLVVVDAGLPIGGGETVRDMLAQDPTTAHIKVLVLGGKK